MNEQDPRHDSPDEMPEPLAGPEVHPAADEILADEPELSVPQVTDPVAGLGASPAEGTELPPAASDPTTHGSRSLRRDAAKAADHLRTDARHLAADSKPMYAAVGMTDMAVERTRDLGEQVMRTGRQTTPQRVAGQVGEIVGTVLRKAGELAGQVEGARAKAGHDAKDRLEKLQHGYEEAATRGEGLVERVRQQPATQELAAQIDTAVAKGKELIAGARGRQGRGADRAGAATPHAAPVAPEPTAAPAARMDAAELGAAVPVRHDDGTEHGRDLGMGENVMPNEGT